jgi:monoamine oxidase
VILEARDRTGGRVLSGLELAGSAGIHVDMGAAWFWPDIQPDFAQLIERLNLPVIAHGRPGDMLYERQLDSPPNATRMGELPGVFQAEGRNAGADGGT